MPSFSGSLQSMYMFFFRLGAPERSHLIEYSVLAVLLHKAFTERFKLGKKIIRPALFALSVGILLGAMDESVQLLLPHRYFDPEDIVFNSLAVAMAIGTSLLLHWLHRRLKKNR